MKRSIVLFVLLSFITAGVPVLRADEGMWTFDNPPLKQWKERYNFEPSAEWLERLRLASPKLGGGSGAFVSPNGLLATNHHVAAAAIGKLSTKERDLMKTGFYARTQADELKAPDTDVTVLVSFDNVTERVHSAGNSTNDVEAARQRAASISGIEKE